MKLEAGKGAAKRAIARGESGMTGEEVRSLAAVLDALREQALVA